MEFSESASAAHAESLPLYQGTGELRLVFRYLPDWRIEEARGLADRYRQVQAWGPRNQDDTYTAHVTVRVSPVKSEGGRYANVDELVAATRKAIYAGRVDSERHTTIAELLAVDQTMSYTLPAVHQPGLKALPVPVKTRGLFFEREGHLYELLFSCDSREYDRNSLAFEQLLRTFKFK